MNYAISSSPDTYLTHKKTEPAPRVSRMQAGKSLARVLNERDKEALQDERKEKGTIDVFRDAQYPADSLTAGDTGTAGTAGTDVPVGGAPRKPGVQPKA